MNKKIKVVSLFSGGGGLDYGFKKNNYDIIWAIDNNKSAVETYKYNIGNHIICEDINNVDVATIPKCDIVIGGPPCQSFSLAGKRNTEDERGVLVWTYLKIIKKLKPKAFLFENVTGLLSAKNSNNELIFNNLNIEFKKIGYSISYKVINAADYGIPQLRKRVIIVGFRGKSNFEFPKPTHSDIDNNKMKYVSVSDALDDLPNPTADGNFKSYKKSPKNNYQKLMQSNSLHSEHFIPKMSKLDEIIVKSVKPGGNYMDIPKSINSIRIKRLQKEGGHTTCYGRMDPKKPSYTINTYFNRPNVGCNIHYKENRLITIREAMRLQSFPDDYKLIATSKQEKNYIVGNAVPPMLSYILAKELKRYV